MKLELGKRMLLSLPKVAPGVLWIHVASVGEFNTATPILRELKKDHKILLTYFSPRASEYLKTKKELYDYLYPLPFDLPFLIRRFEEKVKPKALLIMERELWPSLLFFTKAPKVWLNAYVKESWRDRLLAGRFSLALVRTEKDAIALKSLGLKEVEVCGNMKLIYEYKPKPLPVKLKGRLFTAGSTHKGEEEIILEAFSQLRREGFVLVLVPRHPSRAKEVKRKSEEKGFRTCLLSEKKEGWEVLVVDRLGVLKDFYAVSEVAFVGGTFVRVGGHNLLEPAFFGVPVLFGPYTFKVEDLKGILVRKGLGYPVRDAEDIVETVKTLKPKGISLREEGKAVKECYLRALKAFLERV